MSAVSAIQIAIQQGIPIYTVTKENIATVLPQLSLDVSVLQDVQNAVNAGKEVTVPKTNISYNGWSGCGYIIIDPVTGAGGYMISGGLAGYWMIGIGLLLMIIALLTMIGTAGVGTPAVAALLMLGFWYVGLGFCLLHDDVRYLQSGLFFGLAVVLPYAAEPIGATLGGEVLVEATSVSPGFTTAVEISGGAMEFSQIWSYQLNRVCEKK